jgi:hypothetical protein
MDYQVKPIGKTCDATGETLVSGSVCYSVLIERNGKIARVDFSEEGWKGPPEKAIGYWRTTVPEIAENRNQPLDPDALLSCFEQMCEDANPAHEKLRYVLALLLVQKRKLKIEGSRQDGEMDFLELIGMQGEGPFEVRDQQLAADEMEQLHNELNGQLNGSWN